MPKAVSNELVAIPVGETAQTTGVGTEGRIVELDGLRGLAILLVIICHYLGNAEHKSLGFWLDHLFTALSVGWSGVDLFFVLSGFLIGGILLDWRESPSYFRTFYARRMYRILPIYYAWLILYAAIIIVGLYAFPGKLPVSAKDLGVTPVYLFFLQNMIYSPSPFQWRWLIVTWSLAVEEQFYLLAPPLIRFLSLRRLVYCLLALIFVAPVLRLFAFLYLPALYYLPQFAMPCRADALALGILAAVGWRSSSFRNYLDQHRELMQRAGAYLLIVLAAQMWWLARPAGAVTYTIGYSTLAVFFTSLLLLTITRKQSMVARAMRSKWLRSLGTVSYCLYLVHLTVNQWAHRILLHTAPQINDFRGVCVTLLAGVVTLSVAFISWKCFEKPMLRRGQRYLY